MVLLFARDRKEYLYVGAFWNRRRRGVVDCCLNISVVLCSGVTTLGDCAIWFIGVLLLGVVLVIVGSGAL